jgi:hypothetical protein
MLMPVCESISLTGPAVSQQAFPERKSKYLGMDFDKNMFPAIKKIFLVRYAINALSGI